MPRWASRITLEVTGVRVDRVQEISDEDAMTEGIGGESIKDGMRWNNYTTGNYTFRRPSNSFATLWQSINDKRGYSWESNPYVWVVEFEKKASDE